MSILKLYFALTICIFVVRTAFATSILTVITPTGIVMGVDGKLIGRTPGTGTKIVLMKTRLIVASLNIQAATDTDTGRLLYSFPNWMKEIEGHLNTHSSVSDLTRIIEDELPKTFAFAADRIKSGALKQDEPGINKEGSLVEFRIAGYEAGVPTEYTTSLSVDWQKKVLLAPVTDATHPKEGRPIDSRIIFAGQAKAISRAGDAQSEAHRKMLVRVPVEMAASSAQKNISLKQASNLIRSLLAIEIEANGEQVGFPITVITLPKTGRGRVMVYERDVPVLSTLRPTHRPDRRKKR